MKCFISNTDMVLNGLNYLRWVRVCWKTFTCVVRVIDTFI